VECLPSGSSFAIERIYQANCQRVPDGIVTFCGGGGGGGVVTAGVEGSGAAGGAVEATVLGAGFYVL